MRILLVSKHYADASPRSFRWTAIAERWAAGSHEVEVISGRHRDGPSRLVTNGVILHAVGAVTPVPAASGRVSPRWKEVLRGGPAGRVKRLLQSAWAGVRWPDESWNWFPSAIGAARAACRAAAPSALISVSDPFTSHLVGLALKRSYPRLRWVADVGDPFSLLTKVRRNNARLYSGLNRRLERAVFDGADAVTFTTEATKAAYTGLFPALARKFHVIPPLAPAAPLASALPAFPATGKLRLVFSGTLDRRTRKPSGLLALFAALEGTSAWDGLELHFFGRVSDCEESFSPYAGLLGRKIFVHGQVDRNTALGAVWSSDVLVNIGFDELPLQLPSKAAEYLAAGKPVLTVYSRQDDCSVGFFAGHPDALALPAPAGAPDTEDVARLSRFLERRREIPESLLEPLRRPHRLESVAGAYLSLIAGSA